MQPAILTGPAGKIRLAGAEADIVRTLSRFRGQVVPWDSLAFGQTKKHRTSVRVALCGIRKKLEAVGLPRHMIQTACRRGLRMALPGEPYLDTAWMRQKCSSNIPF